MTNKKIWLTILAVMLIVCMLCSFVGCKDKEKENPTPTTTKAAKTDGEKAVEQLLNGIENAINEQNLQDLKAGADIDFEVKYGDKTTTYNLAFNIELDLVQNGETTPTYNTSLEGEITDANGDVVLGVYYYDAANLSDVYTGNSLYLRTKDDGLMRFDAPSVAGAMKALAADVNFTDSADISEPMSSASSVVDILKSYLTNATYSDNGSTVSIKLEDIVDGLTDLISGVDISAYTTPLNVDLTLDQVIEAIKSLTINVTTRVDNGKLTGVDLSLGLDDFTLTAKKLNSTDKLLVVKLDEDTTVSISADFKVGDFITHAFETDDVYADIETPSDSIYKENLINAQVSLDFYVSEAININLTGEMNLSLNAGYYTASLKVAANPFKVLSNLKKDGKWDIAFVDTYEVVENPTKDNLANYYTKPNADEETYVSADGTTFNASTTYYTKTAQITNIIDAAKKLLPMFADLQLDLLQTKDASGAAISKEANNATYLSAELVRSYTDAEKTTVDDSYIILNTNLISGSSLSNLKLQLSLLETLPNILKGTSSADDGLDDATLNTLKTIGGYLLGAYIGVNDGETGHGAIYASFDSSKTTNKQIPFSGYTPFYGTCNSAYQYYTFEKATGVTEANFGDYFVYVADGNTFVKATEYKANETYYQVVKEDANITSFSKTNSNGAVQYYVGPEYGVGLKATLNTANLSTAVTSTSGLITATIDGLDFIKGMPKSLTVSIGNIHASLFDFTPNYAVGDTIQTATASTK